MKKHSFTRIGIAFVLLACMLIGLCGPLAVKADAATYFHAYKKYDYETTSDRFSLSVDGNPVDVVTYYQGRYDYAHLAYEGTASFTVKCLKGDIDSYNVSPHSYDLDISVSGNTLTFTMEQRNSRYVMVEATVDGTTYQLFIACDPKLDIEKPDLNADNVINIMDRGIQMPYSSADGKTNSSIIQAAINELSNAGGGTLYFPAGTYKFVTLDAKSNVTVFLDEGAVLRGSGKRTDYGWADSGQNGRQVKRKDILIQNCENFSIIGYGMIDGNAIPLALKRNLITAPNVDDREQSAGYYPDGWDDFRKGIVDAYDANNITFKGIAFKDATGWTLNIQRTNNIEASNVKLLDDWDVVHSDGYDFCSCQNVLVTDCLGVCGDDVFCPKAETSGVDTCNMRFQDSVAYALGGAGCKVGVASRSDAYNIEFNNIDVIQGYRGFSLSHDEGSGKWYDIRFIDVRTERLHIANMNDTGQYRSAPFILWTLERDGQRGTVSDIEVTRCSIEDCGGLKGIIRGCKADAAVSNVTFTDLVMDGVVINSDNYGNLITQGENTANIVYNTQNLASYEAENALLSDGAEVRDKGAASGGKMVGNVGDAANGAITFTVQAEKAGPADVTVYYLTKGGRNTYVTANDDPAVSVYCDGDNWDQVRSATVQVDLKAGSNTIKIDNPSGEAAPNIDCIVVETYRSVFEAEHAGLRGGATAKDKAAASEGEFVGDVGGGAKNGSVTFTFKSAAAGKATVDIYYFVNGQRNLYVTANDGAALGVACQGDGWNNVRSVSVDVELEKGENTIVLDNGVDGYGPDLDKIEVHLPSVNAVEPEPDVLIGDVDFNGVVDTADILRLKELILNNSWTDAQLAMGDLNGNGKLDVVDILAVKRIVLGS